MMTKNFYITIYHFFFEYLIILHSSPKLGINTYLHSSVILMVIESVVVGN